MSIIKDIFTIIISAIAISIVAVFQFIAFIICGTVTLCLMPFVLISDLMKR